MHGTSTAERSHGHQLQRPGHPAAWWVVRHPTKQPSPRKCSAALEQAQLAESLELETQIDQVQSCWEGCATGHVQTVGK